MILTLVFITFIAWALSYVHELFLFLLFLFFQDYYKSTIIDLLIQIMLGDNFSVTVRPLVIFLNIYILIRLYVIPRTLFSLLSRIFDLIFSRLVVVTARRLARLVCELALLLAILVISFSRRFLV